MTSVIAQSSAHSTDNSNVSVTLASTAQANLLIVSAQWYTGAGGGTSVTLTDSNGNTWIPLTAQSGGAQPYHTQLFYCFSPTVGTNHSFTLTSVGGTCFPVIGVVAAAGSIASPLDVQNGAAGASISSLQTGSVTPLTNGELVVSSIAYSSSGPTVNNALKASTQDPTANSIGGGIAYHVQSSTSAISPTWTLSGSGTIAVAIAVFKAVIPSGVAAGKIQFVGDPISDSDFSTAFSKAKAFDNDYASYWSSSGNNGWIGMDMGLSVTVSDFEVAPQPSAQFETYERRIFGAQVQSSSASNFSSPTTYFTIPTPPVVPFFPPRVRNRTHLLGGSAQYWRLNFTENGGPSTLAELRFFGPAGTLAMAKPIAPKFSPWGSSAVSGSATVTITCETTSASIYYTTDGSAPTQSSTLYSGPFTLTVGTATQVRAIAFDTTCPVAVSEEAQAYFRNYEFKARDTWYDTNGEIVEAHNPHIREFPVGSGTYLMVANSANAGVGTNDAIGRYGIWLYKATLTDTGFSPWQPLGNIIPTPPDRAALLRPHLLYCAATGQLVIWAKEFGGGSTARSYYCTATTADGAGVPANWIDNGRFLPDGQSQFADFSTFTFDGTRYVIYDTGLTPLIVSKLRSDYLRTTGTDFLVLPSGYTGESPVAVQVGSTLFVIFDGVANYYDSTSTYDRQTGTTTAPLTTLAYSTPVAFDAISPLGTDFNAQPSSLFTIPGKVDGSVMMLADYWLGGQTGISPAPDQYASRAVWMPIDLTGSVAAPLSLSSWDFSRFESAASTTSLDGTLLVDGGLLLNLNSDNGIYIVGLTDLLTDSYVTTATVTATVNTLSGTTIGTVTLSYVSGSMTVNQPNGQTRTSAGGNYRGLLPSSTSLTEGVAYNILASATNGTSQRQWRGVYVAGYSTK